MYHLYKRFDINNYGAKLNSISKIKSDTIFYLLNANGTMFNFYTMKPKYMYILLKIFLFQSEWFKFLLNEIIISQFHSKTFSLPIKV